MPRFYIVQKSNWQNDHWKAVAGSFPTRAAAEAQKENYEYHFVGQRGIDLKSEKHAKVVSRTWLVKNGFYPRSDRGDAELVQAIATTNWNMHEYDAIVDAEIRLGM